jgi:cytidine deaminase
MSVIDDMLRLGLEVRNRAHAPYSQFKVGAVLRAASGRLYAGCNVENAAFPQGQCAEATAIGVMVAAGDSVIEAVLVVADGEHLVSPCGGCRQRLREFAGDATPIYICALDGLRRTTTLGELLPLSFGPQNLQ